MKKKILVSVLVVLSFFLVIGCNNKKEEVKKPTETKKETTKKSESTKDVYIKYVQELRKVEKTSEELPFTVEVKYEKMDDEVRYQVIIDNPTMDITDITALAVHDKQTDDVFPSVGIFDDKVDLIPNTTPSGVILVGYIPYTGEIDDFECEIKVLVSYKSEEKTNKVYYVTKK